MASWQWALEFQPTDRDGGTNPAAVPIGDVLGVQISYGKRGDALSYSGGTMVVQLDNTTSAYTPNAGGTYSNARFLGTTVKLYADVTGAGAPAWTHGPPAAFTGVVTDIDFTFGSTFDQSVTVTVSDALTMLGTLSFSEVDSGNGLDITSGSAAAALTAVLAAANGVTSQITQTSIVNPSGDAGRTMQTVTDYTDTAGSLIQNVEHSDGGDVYVRHGLPIDATTPYNALTFRTRGQQAVTDAVTGVTGLVPLNLWDARLTESGTEPHNYASIDLASGTTASYSQAVFTRNGGTAQKATANADEFGARVINRSDLLCNSDGDTLNLAEAFLFQYGSGVVPPLAVRGIRMQQIVEGDNDDWQLVKTSIGDGCTVRLRPEGATSTIVLSGYVSGVKWQITPAASRLTVQLEDGDQTVAFLLDSNEFGILNVNRLG